MTKNFYIAAFVVSMLAFSSCKIGKRYVRPELNLPDRIEAYTDTTDTASVENIPWESLYADEALKDLIRKALDNNKDMKIAAAKVKEMIAAKRISFASMLPEVGANIYAQKERLNYGGDNPKPDPEFGAKLTLSWELDLWGNLRWANEAAIASYMETVEGQRALRLTIIAEVASIIINFAPWTKSCRSYSKLWTHAVRVFAWRSFAMRADLLPRRLTTKPKWSWPVPRP